MSNRLPVFYDCLNCPSYCCTYVRIEVFPEDIERLAKHFDLSVGEAEARFTKKGIDPGEVLLKHQEDPIYGTACTFLNLETRLCSIHESRPEICRDHPGKPTCAYYVFLMSERHDQEDPDQVARAYNIRGEYPELDAGDD